MSRILVLTLAASAVALGAAAPSFAQPGQSCFRLSQLQSTHPDGDTRIYARVNVNDYFRIDLAHRCSSLLSYPGVSLVMVPAAGNDLICTPLDLDLKVNDHGIREPCIIKSITKLTPEEAAAIPKKVKP